jgi:hypothetical protein
MIQEFIFTSKSFPGSLHFIYEKGVLIGFQNNAQLEEKQIFYLQNRFPFKVENLEEMAANSSGQITEVTELSFDIFWEKYAYKVDKINAQKVWEKLPKAEKINALTGIYRYQNQCTLKGVPKVYPERYLKYKRWLDEN